MSKFPVLRIAAPDSGATAAIAPAMGFNCFSWRAPFAGDTADPAPRELLWAEPGFERGEGRPSRSGVPLLAPFPGRIENGRVEWEGVAYQLDDTSGQGHAIHGFAPRNPWRVLEQGSDRVTAEFRPSIDAPHALGQWPGDYVLTATYAVAASRLVLDFAATNPGDRPMPFGFGTHAYFRLPLAEGADPEGTLLSAPVEAVWESVEMIPTGREVDPSHDEPLRVGGPLAGRVYDTAFRLARGGTQTELVEPTTGRRLRQTFDSTMTCCVVYTPEHREAICLEPYTCTPDLLNVTAKGASSGLIVLAPGQTYQTRVVLEAFVA